MKYAIAGVIVAVLLTISMRSRAEDKTMSENKLDSPATNAPASGSSGVIAIDNNNPLNIRETGDDWDGLGNPRSKKGFFNFSAPKWGFRAAAKIILITYPTRYGIETLGNIISRWAPPSENATSDYISYVVKRTGLSAADRVDKTNIVDVLAAMARLESGKEWARGDIVAGVDLI